MKKKLISMFILLSTMVFSVYMFVSCTPDGSGDNGGGGNYTITLNYSDSVGEVAYEFYTRPSGGSWSTHAGGYSTTITLSGGTYDFYASVYNDSLGKWFCGGGSETIIGDGAINFNGDTFTNGDCNGLPGFSRAENSNDCVVR